MQLSVPPDFSLAATVAASWLRGLAPLSYDQGRLRLCLAAPGADGEERAHEVIVTEAGRGQPLHVAGVPGDAAEALLPALRAALRLDEDLSLFYDLAERDPALRGARQAGLGRVLRSPTAYEDLVKALLWGTGSMALAHTLSARLCDRLGPPPLAPGGPRAFPSARVMASQPLSYYEEELGAGRLARPLWELAQACHLVVYPETVRRAPQPLPALPPERGPARAALKRLGEDEYEWADRLESLLLSLPGIGLRATALLMPLCGCYDDVQLTRPVCAAFYRRVLRESLPDPAPGPPRPPWADRTTRRILTRLSRFGPYRGLALSLLLRITPPKNIEKRAHA